MRLAGFLSGNKVNVIGKGGSHYEIKIEKNIIGVRLSVEVVVNDGEWMVVHRGRVIKVLEVRETRIIFPKPQTI